MSDERWYCAQHGRSYPSEGVCVDCEAENAALVNRRRALNEARSPDVLKQAEEMAREAGLAPPYNSKGRILVERDEATFTDDTVAVTLASRGHTHGAFCDNATIALALRTTMREAPNWPRLAPEQQLALEEIALKVGRILSTGSDPQHTEHWHDIIGYGTLGEKACVKK